MTNEEFNKAVTADIKAILKREENLLEDAAMEYGRAVRDYESARLQTPPESFYAQLRENIGDAMDNLKDAALQHFDDRFDGGAE
jgi:type VI protein secretion system component VasF